MVSFYTPIRKVNTFIHVILLKKQSSAAEVLLLDTEVANLRKKTNFPSFAYATSNWVLCFMKIAVNTYFKTDKQ